MSSFTTPLHVEITQRERSGRGIAKLVKQFEYAVGDLYAPKDLIVVPVGFETDFMSVPWGFRNLVAVFGKRAKAAVVHDYMLVAGYGITYTNKVFREALLVLGASKLEANLLYWVVQAYTHVKKALGGKFD